MEVIEFAEADMTDGSLHTEEGDATRAMAAAAAAAAAAGSALGGAATAAGGVTVVIGWDRLMGRLAELMGRLGRRLLKGLAAER